jgi:osmotically inducible protein OsmC
MPTSKASAVWNGRLKDGNGTYKGATGFSGAYNFGSRFMGDGSASTPEELLAAAEAACYSMALSLGLEKNGTPSTKVETSAACTVEKVGDGFTITKMELQVKATAPGIDAAAFQKIVQATKEGCPVSRALKGVDISVNATLG